VSLLTGVSGFGDLAIVAFVGVERVGASEMATAALLIYGRVLLLCVRVCLVFLSYGGAFCVLSCLSRLNCFIC
jgi:hypothetical protein